MSDLPDEGDDSNQLPAKDLCNSWGTGNPILGKGALGNEMTGRMYYTDTGKRGDLVKILQKMLKELGYDIGASGPDGDGVDGKFGDVTEKVVKKFQEEHKNWDGDALKVDGLVGPETSDAMNRQMVGRELVEKWYRHYQTPQELVRGMPYHTAMSEYIQEGLLTIEPGDAQRGKVFFVGSIPVDKKTKPFKVRVFDPYFEPYSNKPFLLSVDEEFKLEDNTKSDGTIEAEIPFDVKQIDLEVWIESSKEGPSLRWRIEIGPIPNEDTPKGAAIRLRNLGYYSGEIPEDMTDSLRDAIESFQWDFDDLAITRDLDQKTCERLRNQHGS